MERDRPRCIRRALDRAAGERGAILDSPLASSRGRAVERSPRHRSRSGASGAWLRAQWGGMRMATIAASKRRPWGARAAGAVAPAQATSVEALKYAQIQLTAVALMGPVI